MATELIFFDLDDTLCRQGKLTENNRKTLDALRETTDVTLAIATGRGVVMIPPGIRQLIDADYFDAVICANGQYNASHGQLVSHYPLNRDDAGQLAHICNQFDLPYQMLSENHIAWSRDIGRYDDMRKVFADACVIDPHYFEAHAIYQFSVFLTESEEHAHHEYAEAFAEIGYHFTRWQGEGADIMPDGASKARGIDDICAHLGIAVENTMAFGDGLNDMEMLQHVGIGVAMDNAWQQLKDVADYVTDSVEDDGIKQALIHFGVL